MAGTDLDACIERMLGGQASFIENHWRRAPLHAPHAGRGLEGSMASYGVEQFLADVVATQAAPYVAVHAEGGHRRFSRHASTDSLRDAVSSGSVCAIKASKLWYRENAPASWDWMRLLFGRLCSALAMLYMSPDRSEDVDIFLAGPRSTLGTHFDTTDVFTLQLYGERKWIVEEQVHLEKVLQMTRERDWNPAKEIGFNGPTREVTLRAGDAFYVPAYAVHSVQGVSWSVSLSLGLRAFNEIDVVDHVLQAIRLAKYLSYPPLRSLPASAGEAHVQAKLELLQRVRALLRQVEGTAAGYLLSPLELPAALGGPPPEPGGPLTDGAYRTGFALDDEIKPAVNAARVSPA